MKSGRVDLGPRLLQLAVPWFLWSIFGAQPLHLVPAPRYDLQYWLCRGPASTKCTGVLSFLVEGGCSTGKITQSLGHVIMLDLVHLKPWKILLKFGVEKGLHLTHGPADTAGFT